MADRPDPPKSEPCDGKDHKITPERVQVLANDADAFNWALHMNRTDDHAGTHIDEADAAGKAFWLELTSAPTAERELLLRLVTANNKAMVSEDPAMPRIEFDMDKDAFLRSLTIKYPLPFSTDKDGKPKEYVAALHFVYQGRGMCARFTPWAEGSSGIHMTQETHPPELPQALGSDKPIIFPTLGLPLMNWRKN